MNTNEAQQPISSEADAEAEAEGEASSEESVSENDQVNRIKNMDLKEITREFMERNEMIIQEIKKFDELKKEIYAALEKSKEDLDNEEGLLDRIRMNIGGYYYDIRHREHLFRREGFPLNYLFKKKWEKYLMKDITGRIYFDYEPEGLIPILKYMQGDNIEFPGTHWEMVERAMEVYNLKNYVSAKIPRLEHLTHTQTHSIIRLFEKMNIESFQIMKLTSIYFSGSYDEKGFLSKVLCQENILMIFWSAAGNAYAVISDRALFLGRKMQTNSHTSSNRYCGNLSYSSIFRINSSKISGGDNIFPMVFNAGSFVPEGIEHDFVSDFHTLTLIPIAYNEPSQIKVQHIECYTFLPSSSPHGCVFSPVFLPGKNEEASSVRMNLNPMLPDTLHEAFNKYNAFSTALMKGYDLTLNEIKIAMDEIVHIRAYYETIWYWELEEEKINFMSYLDDLKDLDIDDIIPNIENFIELKENIKSKIHHITSSSNSLAVSPIVSFNVEGERLCLLKGTITKIIPESVLAIRVSGRWTEHPEDLDEEGSIYIDFPKEIFKPLVQALRQSSYFDRARIDSRPQRSIFSISDRMEGDAKAMFDYFQIPQNIFD